MPVNVLMKTTLGDIQIELDDVKAPISVKNFLEYVDAKFYDGLIFHRVIPGFMAQGGGLEENMEQKDTRSPIKNEAKNGLKNLRGTLAMARTSVIDSATAQFFINLVDNAFLDNGPRDFGYAVFGKVTKGMEVVDAMAKVPTTRKAGMSDVPSKTIKIISVTRIK